MDHKKLSVWKSSMSLVELIYQISNDFPKSEKFGLTSQIRRAAVSIPSNISEGASRNGNREFIHYISISIGSLLELETLYLIAIRLKYMPVNEKIELLITELKRLLLAFRNHLRRNPKPTNH